MSVTLIILTILVALALFVAVLWFELKTDLKAWQQSTDVRHRSKPLRRFALLLPSIAGLSVVLPTPWYTSFIVSTIFIAFLWWFLFDGLYNIRRQFNWWFNGDANGKVDDSWLDMLLRKLTDKQERWLKIGTVCISALVYILILLRFQFIL